MIPISEIVLYQSDAKCKGHFSKWD